MEHTNQWRSECVRSADCIYGGLKKVLFLPHILKKNLLDGLKNTFNKSNLYKSWSIDGWGRKQITLVIVLVAAEKVFSAAVIFLLDKN